MNRQISIIEFPSNLGLKEPATGTEPGVKHMPDHFKNYGFHTLLKSSEVTRLTPPEYSMQLDEISGVRNADKIVQYAAKQCGIVCDVMKKGAFPIVLGGDCSILIGNALALKKMGTYAIFFLDGHSDFMWPSASQTGGAAGMDLAIVTGYGHDKLTNIKKQKPYFKEEHVWCVGNRDYEEWYVETILNTNIRYIDLDTLRNEGINNVVAGFLQMVTSKNLDGYWIHIDVDVLNDNIMPAVDSRQPGGLDYDEFTALLRLLLHHSKAAGVEITILDPNLDQNGFYTKDFISKFHVALNPDI